MGGYQAARWDGRQAELYGESSTLRNEADQSLTLGGQQRLQLEKGADLNDASDRLFDEGTEARHQADEYIRTTVVLATVLFLLALSQRFLIWRVRVGVVVLAAILMVYGVVTLLAFPRI